MKASLALSLPKGKEVFGLYYGLNIAQRRGGLICSSLVPQRRSRARRAYLTCVGCPHSRRDLLWVSSGHLNTLGTKSHFGAHAHGEV